MRYQFRTLSAVSILVITVACGGGSPTAPSPAAVSTPTATTPAPTRAAVTVTMEVRISPNPRGASSQDTQRTTTRNLGATVELTLTANNNVMMNNSCGITIGSTTQPIESLTLSANLASGSPFRVEKGLTLVMPLPLAPNTIGTVRCEARGQDANGDQVVATKDGVVFINDLPGVVNTCVVNANTMCLFDGALQVNAQSNAGGQVRPLEVNPAERYFDGGAFWFSDSHNIAATIQVLNECPFRDRYTFYGTALSDVTVLLTDLRTGTQQRFIHSPGPNPPPVNEALPFPCVR